MASYKIGDVAELLGISVDSVRRLADSGKLATIRTAGGQRVVNGRQIGGEVVAINDRLDKEPALVNTDPYGTGWMIRVKPTNPAEIDALMKSDAYTKHIGQ